MDVGYFLLFIFWNVFGFAVYATVSPVGTAGFELVNPCVVYKHHKSLNWFGTLLVSLLYNIMCPIGSACYWFYKLCTVGRKHK